jgi:hypothetical protein
MSDVLIEGESAPRGKHSKHSISVSSKPAPAQISALIDKQRLLLKWILATYSVVASRRGVARRGHSVLLCCGTRQLFTESGLNA